jgi:hypothetical protein
MWNNYRDYDDDVLEQYDIYPIAYVSADGTIMVENNVMRLEFVDIEDSVESIVDEIGADDFLAVDDNGNIFVFVEGHGYWNYENDIPWEIYEEAIPVTQKFTRGG